MNGLTSTAITHASLGGKQVHRSEVNERLLGLPRDHVRVVCDSRAIRDHGLPNRPMVNVSLWHRFVAIYVETTASR